MVKSVSPRLFSLPPARPDRPTDSDRVELGGLPRPVEIPPELVLRAQRRGFPRDPQEAVRFVERFTQQLNLSERSQAERKAMLRKAPSAFFRMFPSLYHEDLRGPYAEKKQLLDRPAPVQIIDGDCHLANFGSQRHAGSTVLFALNDYDQAGQGTVEADLSRLATSIQLLAKEMGQGDRDTLVSECARGYLENLRRLSTASETPPAGISVDEAQGSVKKYLQKACEQTQAELLHKYSAHGKLLRNEELEEASAADWTEIEQGLAEFDAEQGPTPDLARPLRLLDVARKLGSGGSSRGLGRFYVLLEGPPGKPEVILELKQLLPSPIESSSGDLSEADADLVLAWMEALGSPTNPCSGSVAIHGYDYLIREREREKRDLPLGKLDAQGWRELCRQAGAVLAQAHVQEPGNAERILKWVGPDSQQLTTNLQTFARDYAAQTEADHAALLKKL